MPEYYSFVTSRIADKKIVDEICEQLAEEEITYQIIESFGKFIIAGTSCEEDCGIPFNLYYIFNGNDWDAELVYINYAGEYGYIKNELEEQQAKRQIRLSP